jgi:PAS domain S-box-containing protein
VTNQRKTFIYLIIAESEEVSRQCLQSCWPDDPVTSLCVSRSEQLLEALQGQAWDAVIYAQHLAEFPPDCALKTLQESGVSLPFFVLPESPKKSENTAQSRADASEQTATGLFSPGRVLISSERQKADLLLRESERFFRTLTEHSSDATLLISVTGKVLYTLSSIRHLLGYDPQSFVGSSLLEYLPPEDGKILEQALTELSVQPGESCSLRLRVRHHDDSWNQIETRLTNLLDEPSIQAMVVNFQNVTDRVQAEESRARLAAILEATPDFVSTCNVNGQVLYINRAGRRMTGRSDDEDLSPTHISNYLPKWANQMIAEKSHPTVLRDGVWAGESAILAHDGREIPVSQITLSHKNAAGEIEFFSSVARDLSEWRQAEAERQHLEQQLYESQKIESIGTLAGGVAHDFNNLLTAIIGNTQLAMARLPQDHSIYLLLKEITRASERAASLTRQLLAFSRRQQLERQRINLSETINDFIQMLQRIIGEDIEIHLQRDAESLPVFADPRQMEQVIMNLAVNARDAMPDGGQLMIETRLATLNDDFCRKYPWARPGDYGQITISDNGEGMDEETQRHIFEPFFTTKEPGRGTGLGLAVVYGIIKQHDGFMNVSSRRGSGTSFEIFLPMIREEGQQKTADAAIVPGRGDETILLAEDEEMLRDLLRTVLTELGYTVLSARDGIEAVQMFQIHRERIDLVMLDVVMPRRGGIEAWQQICASGKTLPVIFMTGYSAEIVQADFLRRDKARLIAKPYDIDLLGRQVREVLDQHRHFRQQAG